MLPQVCGGQIDQMTRAAQLLDDTLGPEGVDFVDINCGKKGREGT